jgi:hypothetical protein
MGRIDDKRMVLNAKKYKPICLEDLDKNVVQHYL